MRDSSYVLGGTIRVDEDNPKATGCPEMVPVLRAVRHDAPRPFFPFLPFSLSLSLSLSLSSLTREVKNLVIGIPEANFLDLSRSARRQSRKSTPAGKFRGIFVAWRTNDLNLGNVCTRARIARAPSLINIDPELE
jgi:hypothetical protein